MAAPPGAVEAAGARRDRSPAPAVAFAGAPSAVSPPRSPPTRSAPPEHGRCVSPSPKTHWNVHVAFGGCYEAKPGHGDLRYVKHLRSAAKDDQAEVEKLRGKSEAMRRELQTAEAQLEDRKGHLQAARDLAEDLRKELRWHEERKACEFAEKQAEAAAQAALERDSEAQVHDLKMESALLQRHCGALGRQAAAAEAEWRELRNEEDSSAALQQKLQAEILALQQEFEGSRVDLAEVQNLLRGSGDSLEQLARHKLELEWELEQRRLEKALMQRTFDHNSQSLSQEVELERRHEKLVAGNRCEADRLKAEARQSRHTAVALDEEANAAAAEREELEREVRAAEAEAARLRRQAADVRDRAVTDQRLEAAARRALSGAQVMRDQLLRQMAEIQGQGSAVQAESLELQEERALLLVGQAKRQVQRALQMSPEEERLHRSLAYRGPEVPGPGRVRLDAGQQASPKSWAPRSPQSPVPRGGSLSPMRVKDDPEFLSAHGVDPAACAGFFIPAGAARGARQRADARPPSAHRLLAERQLNATETARRARPH